MGSLICWRRPVSRTLAEFSAHYHGKRDHQGEGNDYLFPMLGMTPTSAASGLSVAGDSESCYKFYVPRRMNSFDHTG